MKSFDTELKKYAEKINLKVSERRELRERILSYMEYHPLKKHALTSDELTSAIPGESFSTLHFNINSLYTRFAGGVLILFLIAAPFAAEKAVPGDVLYLVKTGFNESIQGQLANSPYEKIEFGTKLMERRIAEARELAGEGKLTEEVKTQIAEDVKGHTTAVQVGLAELRTQDADGAAIAEIAFNASLEVQSVVLGVEESTENDSLIDTILTVVNDARNEVTSNQEANAPSFKGLRARVELETTRAFELFETIKISASAEEITDIERRLSDVNRLITESENKRGAEPETAAADLATTLGLLQKLIVFMADINVREAVTLEEIVPVVLSDAERTDLAKQDLRVLTEGEARITQRLELLKGKGVVEKVTDGLTRVAELLLMAHTALGVSNIDGAEGAIAEAKAFLADLDKMTAHVDKKVVPLNGKGGAPVTEGEVSAPEAETGTSTVSAISEERDTENTTSRRRL